MMHEPLNNELSRSTHGAPERASHSASNRIDEGQRLLTEAGMQDLHRRIQSFTKGGGLLEVQVHAWWRGSLRWARNRVSLSSDQRDVQINITREQPGSVGSVTINQIDDASLRAAVSAAERRMNTPGTSIYIPYPEERLPDLPLPYPDTAIWSDVTYNVSSAQRAQVANTLTQGAENEQLFSAGSLQMYAYESNLLGDRLDTDYRPWRPSNEPPQGQGGARTTRDEGYMKHTEAQCSMTVRHPKGLGSGWAGLSSYDWSAIDGKLLAERALDKCVKSLNPVKIEPGRYTVIMEPQAAFTFASSLVSSLQGRAGNEQRRSLGVFSDDFDPTLELRMTKLGQLIVDERITVSHNPMDAQLGIIPKRGLAPVTWIEKGRLINMGYDRDGYSLPTLHEDLPIVDRSSFKMNGGTTSMEEMIASTIRGVLVTRFSGVQRVPNAGLSLLMTGLTRDGLWLVENGKITKSVNNMRFTDSPLYVFNNLEQIGPSVPVFNSDYNRLSPAIVPPIKSREFAFTSTIDAI